MSLLDELSGMETADSSDVSLRPNYDAATPIPARMRGPRVIVLETDDVATDVALITKTVAPASFNAHTAWATTDGTVVMVAAQDDERSRMLLTNAHATDSVYIGNASNLAGQDGYLLVPGRTLELFVRTAIYAVVVAGGSNNIPISTWIERD